MENTLYIPVVVWPTMDASGPHGSMVNPSDWVIPESSATHVHIPISDEETDDNGCGNIMPGHMTHRSHVLSRQRHALLTHHNMMFQRRIGLDTSVSNDDGDSMVEDRVDINIPFPQSVVTNNGNY